MFLKHSKIIVGAYLKLLMKPLLSVSAWPDASRHEYFFFLWKTETEKQRKRKFTKNRVFLENKHQCVKADIMFLELLYSDTQKTISGYLYVTYWQQKDLKNN